jgi:CRP/FNR family nitrogen fixation transcriptional regulator
LDYCKISRFPRVRALTWLNRLLAFPKACWLTGTYGLLLRGTTRISIFSEKGRLPATNDRNRSFAMLATAATTKSGIKSTICARPSILVGSGPLPEGPLGLMGALMRFVRNTEVYGEDEPAEYLYQVISGAVRTCRLLDDGRRQVIAFHLPGDIFGVEAGEMHLCSAETICDSQVLVVKRSSALARAEYEKDLSRQLWTLMVRELQRVQQHSLVLIKSAEERVAGFLLEMASRGSDNVAIELPMSRQDIADYLGLTIETVSRTFTQFVQSGAIALETSRRIRLRNRTALSRLNV